MLIDRDRRLLSTSSPECASQGLRWVLGLAAVAALFAACATYAMAAKLIPNIRALPANLPGPNTSA
jgi:hypothetical protein